MSLKTENNISRDQLNKIMIFYENEIYKLKKEKEDIKEYYNKQIDLIIKSIDDTIKDLNEFTIKDLTELNDVIKKDVKLKYEY